jgi:hypothetical protein
MKNIFVLPTDKPSRLLQCLKVIELLDKKWLSPIGKVNRNIYITNSEKPKEGDWVYENNLNQETKIYQIIKRDGRLMFFRFRSVPIWLDENQHGCKKIILTTDVDLIKDGVQAIDDEFLQWFVNNSSCEKVEVELIDTFKKTNEVYVDEITGGNYYEIIKKYKIIIPKEETKPVWKQIIEDCGGEEAFMEAAGLKPKQDRTCSNNCSVVCGECQILEHKQEPCDNCNNDVCCCTIKKQETIEDGANKWVFETNADRWSNNDDTAGDNYGSFIAGAKSDVAKNYWYAKFKDENGLKNIK